MRQSLPLQAQGTIIHASILCINKMLIENYNPVKLNCINNKLKLFIIYNIIMYLLYTVII